MTIFEGLSSIQDTSLSFQVLLKCLKVLNLLKNHTSTLVELHHITNDITILARLWSSVSFIHVHCSHILIDDKLARRVASQCAIAI